MVSLTDVLLFDTETCALGTVIQKSSNVKLVPAFFQCAKAFSSTGCRVILTVDDQTKNLLEYNFTLNSIKAFGKLNLEE